MKNINKKWYSIIVIILIIWFLTVLTTWVFRLVASEKFDNRVVWNYIKTYASAESSQELALLWIKEQWYWFNQKKENETLWSGTNDFNAVKYSFLDNWPTKDFSGEIKPAWSDLVPLFVIDSEGKLQSIDNLNIKILSDDKENFSRNIVTSSWNGISGDGKKLSWNGNIDTWVQKIIENINDLKADKIWNTLDEKINEFLRKNNKESYNYLQIFNWWQKNIKYNLTSEKDFTKPEIVITSSWETWDYRTNIDTTVHVSEMFNRSKYSIFSP